MGIVAGEGLDRAEVSLDFAVDRDTIENDRNPFLEGAPVTTHTAATHHIVVESNTADGFLLVCPEASCGRRVVIHRKGGMTVLDRGDFFAHHVGGNEGLDLAVA